MDSNTLYSNDNLHLSLTTHPTDSTMHPTNLTPSLKTTSVRWVVLFCAGLCQFGYEYTALIFQAIQGPIEQTLEIDDAGFNLIYFIGDSPCWFTPIILGAIIDHMGNRLPLVSSLLVTVVGSAIMILGLYLGHYWLLIGGRFVFSFLMNGFFISEYKIICRWFEGKQMGIALGINLVLLRSADMLVNVVSPAVYNATQSTTITLTVGFAMCILSLVSGVVTYALDQKLDTFEPLRNHQEQNTQVTYSDLKNIPRIVWVIIICASFSYSGFSGFYVNGLYYVSSSFNFTPEAAGRILIFTPFSSILADFAVGHFMDKHGKRPILILMTTVSLLFGLVLLALLPESNDNYYCIIALILLGFYYGGSSVVNSGCLPVLVKPELLGLVYGTLFFSIYLAGLLSPVPFGYLVDESDNDSEHGFLWSTLFLVGLVVVGLKIAVYIYWTKSEKASQLDDPSSKFSSDEESNGMK